MNKQTCGNCVHFRLHYIRRGRKYFSLRYGHCVCPRLKKRDAAQAACQYWKSEKEEPHISD